MSTTSRKPFRRAELIDRITKDVRQIAVIATPTGARIQHIELDKNNKVSKIHVNSEWSQRDLTCMEKSTFSKDYFVDLSKLPSSSTKSKPQAALAEPPTEANAKTLTKAEADISSSTYVTSVVNPGRSDSKTVCYGGQGMRACITNYKPGETSSSASASAAAKDEQELLEVWSPHGKLSTLNLSKSKKHGKVYADAEFGSFHFSPDVHDPHILYVAEKYLDKSDSFYDERRENVEPGEKSSQPPAATIGEQSAFREDWGEQMREKTQPILAIVDYEGNSISVLENTTRSADMSCGQPTWTPDASGVVFVGVRHGTRRLGIIYCTNRECALYYLKLDASVEAVPLTAERERSVKAPRFSPDGKTLIYLERAAGGPHHSGMQLKKMSWPPSPASAESNSSSSTAVVVDLVSSIKDKTNVFPGIYPEHAGGLPRRCFSADSKYVFLSTDWRSRIEIIGINLSNGKVTRLTNDEKYPCYNLLDVYGSYIVAARSSPTIPPHLVIARVPDEVNGAEQILEWYALDAEILIDAPPKWEIVSLNVPNDPKNDIEIICLSSPYAVEPCVVLVPHGGPHSVFSATFYWTLVAMSRLDVNVVMVNYRGSIGFGEDSVNSLLGHIGDHDVDDCMRALDYVIGKYGWLKEKVCLYGGSHGGFLITSLIGQQPDLFAACATRNPVTNLASMISATDIPDWAIVEADNPPKQRQPFVYDGKTMPNLQKLHACSPIVNVQKVRTPTLIALGADDARVPPFQGIEYYQALRAHNVPCKLLSYKKNCHPIDKVDAETDFFVHLMLWFKQWTEELRP